MEVCCYFRSIGFTQKTRGFRLGDVFLPRWLLAVFCLFGGVLPCSAALAGPTSPIGDWLTANRNAVIAIAPCGARLCGSIAGVTLDHPTDPMPTDWRGQPQCGDMIINVSPVPDTPDQWQGTVTDPRDGNVWQAMLTLEDGILQLRGYVGLPLFGESESWTPYTGQIRPGCLFTS